MLTRSFTPPLAAFASSITRLTICSHQWGPTDHACHVTQVVSACRSKEAPGSLPGPRKGERHFRVYKEAPGVRNFKIK